MSPQNGTDGAMMMSGQCHRYSEYEMSPTNCAGRIASTRVGYHQRSWFDAMITAAAPSVGTAAA